MSSFDLPNSIRLTEFRPTDVDSFVEWLAERDIYDRTLRIPFPYSADDARAWLAIVDLKTRKNSQPVQWAIRNEADRLIGAIGLDDLVLGKSHQAELGYWLAKPYWGRGIITSAVRPICRHVFDNLGLTKIAAHVFAGNDGSVRVLEKCGFEQEGYLRQHFLKDDRRIDVKLYGLLRG